MALQPVVRIVDALLALEECSLLQRVAEAESFVTDSEVEDAFAIQEMIEEERNHRRMLVDLLDVLDATPSPRRVWMSTVDLHYNKMHVLLPRLIADKKRLIAEYTSVAPQIAGEPHAADVIAKILTGHQKHLQRLEALQRATTP